MAATVLGSGLAQLTATVVNVALPSVGRDLGGGLIALQWMLNAYMLTLSGLLLLGGNLGDRLGRRRVFTIGVVVFAIASVGCAAAPSMSVLIAMRALQGIGGALLTPGSLAILEAAFRRDDRAAAVGAWSGLGGVATAIGPVLGGALVGLAPWGWRLAFLLNVPLAVAVLFASRHIPETRDDRATGHLDIPGAVLAAAGLAALIFGLTTGPSAGWTVAAMLSTAGGVALLGAFVVNEGRRPSPMMPLSLFASRQFSAANAVTFILYASIGGALFLLPVQLQVASGFSPVAAGSSLLPVTVVTLLISARAGRLAQRIGPRLPMTVGPLVSAAGLALFARIGRDANYLGDVLPAVLVFGLGVSLTVAPLTATVLAAADERKAGVASAVNNDIARTAGLMAVALLPGLAGITQASYTDPALFSAGFTRAFLIAAALCATGGLLSALLIRSDGLAAAGVTARQAGRATHTTECVAIPAAARR